MYEPQRSLEQPSRRLEKQKQKNKSQPCLKEPAEQETKQEWQPKENTGYLYDVSEDETAHPETRYLKAKAKSTRSGADSEKNHPRSRGSDRDLELSMGNLKPGAVKGMDRRLEIEDPCHNVTPIMKPSGRKKTVLELSRKPLSRPEDIPDEEHSLRQHPTRDLGGDFLLYAGPTGSTGLTGASDVIPLVLKAQGWSIISETRKEIGEAQTREKEYLSVETKIVQGKGKQRAISRLVPRSSNLGQIAPAREGEPSIYFRAKRTVTPRDHDEQLSIEKGEILQFLKKHVLITDEVKDKPKYLFQRRNDRNDLGWVFVKDVEPVDKVAWLRRAKKARG